MTLDDAIAAQVAAALERAIPELADALAERMVAKLQPAARPATPASADKLLGLPAAAKYLGVGETTMRAYVKAKSVRFTCPGGTRYKFRREDLDAFATEEKTRTVKAVDFAEQSRKNLKRALGG